METTESVPKIVFADHVYMTDDTIKAIEEVATVVWATGIAKESLITQLNETNPTVIISEYVGISGEEMDAAPSLKGIISFGVGYDHIDVEEASLRGIYVTNARGANAESVAEHVFACILSFVRRIREGESFIRKGLWVSREQTEFPKMLIAQDLYEKTIGIIGLGAIGARVARIAHGFNMKVLAYDPIVKSSIAKEHKTELVDLEALLKESDIITLHVPLTPETKGMISTQEFSLMKPTTYLFNAARGAVIDEKALIQALEQNKIAGAGLDVFEQEPLSSNNPLLNFDNVILTAHCAGNSKEALDATSKAVTEEAMKVLNGHVPHNLVNRTLLLKNGYLLDERGRDFPSLA